MMLVRERRERPGGGVEVGLETLEAGPVSLEARFEGSVELY